LIYSSNNEELFAATFYSDGIAFSSGNQSIDKPYGVKHTYRLGILEEIEKNKQFRMYGITEEDRATVVSSC